MGKLSFITHSTGLAGIPQTALGFFAGTIREVLNVPVELKMLFGISFGYADPNSPFAGAWTFSRRI